jgi:hypothetical protein
MGGFSDERIASIIAGRKAIRKVAFPPLSCDIGIRCLTEAEIDGARIEAVRYLKKLGADVDMDPEIFDREKERQIVWRSIFDADEEKDPKPFFPADSDVRQIDSVLLRELFTAYLEVQEEISPALSLDEKEVETLIEALGKEGDQLLTLLAPDTLRSCVRSLVSKVAAQT